MKRKENWYENKKKKYKQITFLYVINGFIGWLSVDDIESLDPQIQDVIRPIYEEIQKNDDKTLMI